MLDTMVRGHLDRRLASHRLTARFAAASALIATRFFNWKTASD
jgi:hypothetical protein